jgi:hypothetical protein
MVTNLKAVARSISFSFRNTTKCCAMVLLLCPHLFGFQSSVSAPAGSEGGASAIWIFANLSFTGMRAQNAGSTFWKILSFICGFPGTLLTLMVVESGSERAYGIDMPRKQSR